MVIKGSGNWSRAAVRLSVGLLSAALLTGLGARLAGVGAGSLDASFGTGNADGTPDGFVSLSLGSGKDKAESVAVQADGKLLVLATSTSLEKSENIIVARLNEDGSLDTTFGTSKDGTPDGFVNLSLGAGDDSGEAIAVEADGQIVVVGTSTSIDGKSENIVVARLNEDGSLDTTFGTSKDGTPDGFVSLSLGAGDDAADGLALEDDGQILVAGTSTSIDGKSENMVVARLNEDGSLDTTFGTSKDGTPDGFVNLSLGAGDDSAQAIAVEYDGQIVVLGTSTNVDGKSENMVVAHLNEDGSLDTTFGRGSADGTPDGFVSLSLGAGDESADGMALEFDGQIVVVGTSTSLEAKSANIVAARLNEDGSLDTTFGTAKDGTPDGFVNLTLGAGDDEAESVAVDFDGRVVILGTSTNVDGKSDKMVVARLNEDGSLDTTFGTAKDGTPDGFVSLALGAANDAGQAVTLEFDGDIIVTGTSENVVNKSRKIVVARLLGN